MASKLARAQRPFFFTWMTAYLLVLLGVVQLVTTPRDVGVGVGSVILGLVVGSFALVARSRNWFGWPSRHQ